MHPDTFLYCFQCFCCVTLFLEWCLLLMIVLSLSLHQLSGIPWTTSVAIHKPVLRLSHILKTYLPGCLYRHYWWVLEMCLIFFAFTFTQPFNGPLSRTTWVGWYQKKHSPTHTYPDHPTSFINFLHLLRSIASSLFSLRAWQSFSTTSVQVLFGLSLGLGPSTLHCILFFTQWLSSSRSTCLYHHHHHVHDDDIGIYRWYSFRTILIGFISSQPVLL